MEKYKPEKNKTEDTKIKKNLKESREYLVDIINSLVKNDILDEQELENLIPKIKETDESIDEGIILLIKSLKKRMSIIKDLLETEKIFSEEDKRKALRIYQILKNTSVSLEKDFKVAVLSEEHLN